MSRPFGQRGLSIDLDLRGARSVGRQEPGGAPAFRIEDRGYVNEPMYEWMSQGPQYGGARILDLGSGQGEFPEVLSRLVGSDRPRLIVPFDKNHDDLRVANERLREGRVLCSPLLADFGLKGKSGERRYFPFRDEAFHAVFACSVLNYVPADEVDFLLSEVMRTLEPGGHFTVVDLHSTDGLADCGAQLKDTHEAKLSMELRAYQFLGFHWWYAKLAEFGRIASVNPRLSPKNGVFTHWGIHLRKRI